MTALSSAVLGESARAWAAPGATGVRSAAPALLSGTPISPLALPILGNGINLDQPQYYDTLQTGSRRVCRTRQTADLNGDGSDELVVRTAGGILAWRFDPTSGQWLDLPGTAPLWSDAEGWDQAACYETIQTADVDGDGRAELLGRGPNGLEVWRYDDTADDLADRWVQLAGASGKELLDDTTWVKPAHYQTMQCADIDGDGRDELMVRGPDGLDVWRLEGSDADGWSWTALPGIAALADAGGWHHPMYYTTLQCARLTDPDRSVVLGRGTDALLAWSYNGTRWVELPRNTELSNALGWDAVASYGTIQCADIDGDGKDELLGLGDDGMRAWRLTSDGWQDLTTLTALNGGAGWRHADYYSTIQCADVDADGRAELIARGAAGIRVWRFTGATGSGVGGWAGGPDGPEWSDTLGWNQHEYYSTIQTARVSDGSGPRRALLIGRTSTALATWYLTGGSWGRTTAPWPEISSTILSSVSEQLYSAVDPNGPRASYNDIDKASQWQGYAENKLPTLTPPAGVDAQDWQAAIAQLADEFTWVANVQAHYGHVQDFVTQVNLGNFIDLVSLAGEIQLSTEVQDKTSFVLDVISLVADTAASILGFNAILQKAEKVVSGLESMAATLGSVMLAASDSVDYAGEAGDNSIQGTLTDLEADLGKMWKAAGNRALTVPDEIVGGNNGDNVYVPGDYGLLAAIGSMINSAQVPQWRLTGDGVAASITGAQQGYAEHVWKVLEPKDQWAWSVVLYRFDGKADYDAYTSNHWYWWPIRTQQGEQAPACFQYFLMEWYTSGGIHHSRLVQKDLLKKLLGPRNTSAVFPLGVKVEDVLRARKGWSKLGHTDTYWLTSLIRNQKVCGQHLVPAPYHLSVTPTVEPGSALDGATPTADGTIASPDGPGKGKGGTTGNGGAKGKGKGQDPERSHPVVPPPPTRKGPDLDVTPFPTRLADGGIELTLEVTNRGSAAVTNVEVTDVALQGRRPDRYLPTPRTRIDTGETIVRQVRLPAAPGRTGDHAVLHVALAYLGGSEQENIEIELP